MRDDDSNLPKRVAGAAINPSAFEALRHPRLFPRSIPQDVSLRCQVLGAEFCASLSASMIAILPCVPVGATGTQDSLRGDRRVSAGVTTALLQDLSAHYGSHALRRGSSHPLGPCYRSRKRSLSKGHHDGRQSLWLLAKARRLWCCRCGLYLVTGVTKILRTSDAPAVRSLEEDKVSLSDCGSRTAPRRNRGTYVCCRCSRVEESRRKKGGLLLGENGGSLDTACKGDQLLCTVASASGLSAVVGRTRRRKRRERGTTVDCKDRGTGDAQATALRNVPKGSLFRGKRSRVTASVAEVASSAPQSGKVECKTNGIDDCNGTTRKVRRTGVSANAEKGDCNQAVSKSPGYETTALHQTTDAKVVPPTSFRGYRATAPRKRGAPSSRSNDLFSDTLARLGL